MYAEKETPKKYLGFTTLISSSDPSVAPKCRTIALKASFMMASMNPAMFVPANVTMFESATPTDGVTTLGFIISLCIVEQCLIYDDDKIEAVYIYRNHNITKIPENAFLHAAYLEVSRYKKKNIMHTLEDHFTSFRAIYRICLGLININVLLYHYRKRRSSDSLIYILGNTISVKSVLCYNYRYFHVC